MGALKPLKYENKNKLRNKEPIRVKATWPKRFRHSFLHAEWYGR